MSVGDCMLHYDEVRAILNDVDYKGWKFYVGVMGHGFYLQISMLVPDATTGVPEWQYCRKWYLSRHMTKSEIVQTAWAAVQAAELHEAREKFRYRGAALFKPHYDVDDLAALSRVSSEVRT